MYSYAYQQYPREFDGWWSAYSPYMWEKAYKAIDECNQIIVNADKTFLKVVTTCWHKLMGLEGGIS